MGAYQASFPVTAMARVLGVSTAGYYAWLKRPPSARARADAALLQRVRTVHVASRATCGMPRVHAELQAAGERHGRKRIARLMRDAGLVGVSRRRGGPVTTRRDREVRPAPDLVDRDFSAAGSNQLWVADITFIPTSAGFLCLAPRHRARTDGASMARSSTPGAARSRAGSMANLPRARSWCWTRSTRP